MGLILAMARNSRFGTLPGPIEMVGARFVDKPQHLTESTGSVLLIVGYGSIGRELARRARASICAYGSDAIGQAMHVCEKDSARSHLERSASASRSCFVIAAPELRRRDI